MRMIITNAAVLCTIGCVAQDTASIRESPLTISGYVEAYYNYDFNKPSDNFRPGFLYSHNRHNEFNSNLAFVKAGYSTQNVRANLAIAAGTYMNANYAAESGVLKNILEANAGIKLSKSKNLWLDIGILPSHIGFESAISKDCWTLTRSLPAENSPYFESGARLSYLTENGKLLLSALALNGWQRITRVNGNSLMSWGTQITMRPSDKLLFNYSTFLGTDSPDSTRRWRVFHNLYSIFQLTDKFGITAGVDLGTEQKSKGSSSQNTWFSPVAIFRYTPSSQWAIAFRGEYYSDEEGEIITTGTPNGFKTTGLSLNVDYLPVPGFVLRLEGRTLNSKDRIFLNDERQKRSSTALTFSAGVSF